MPEAKEFIIEFLEGSKESITKDQAAKGLRASGASAASLYTKIVDENTFQLIDGSGSFRFQDAPGRGPSGPTASRIPLHKRIYDWLEFKKYNFNYANDKKRISLSFAIANKIHRKGNYIHITGKTTNVVKDSITTEKLQPLSQKIAKFYARRFTDGVLEKFGQRVINI